jgi:hypothetical protein
MDPKSTSRLTMALLSAFARTVGIIAMGSKASDLPSNPRTHRAALSHRRKVLDCCAYEGRTGTFILSTDTAGVRASASTPSMCEVGRIGWDWDRNDGR